MNMFFDWYKWYEKHKIGRTETKSGIIVSTVLTPDEGFETALIDKKGPHPVERYKDKDSACEGHNKWTKFSAEGIGKEVLEISFSTNPERNRNITLEM